MDRWRVWGAVAGLAIVGALSSCSTVFDEAETDPASMDETGIVGLYVNVPDTPATRAYSSFSLPRLGAELAGLEVPPVGSDLDALLDYALVLSAAREAPPGVTQVPGQVQIACDESVTNLDQADEIEGELGFSFLAVDGVINAGEPLEHLCALTGDFDPDAVNDIVTTEPEFSSILEVSEVDGGEYYRWGDDGASATAGDPYHVTAARPLGRGGRMYVDEQRAYWAFSDAAIESMIGAGVSGTTPSLADDEDYRLVLDRFTEAGIVGGFLSDGVPEGADEVCSFDCEADAVADVDAEFAFGQGMQLWGGGWGLSEAGEPVVVLAIVSAEDTQTEPNLDAIVTNLTDGASYLTQQPWSERMTVADTTVDGRLGLVWLTAADGYEGSPLGRALIDSYYRRDAFLANAD